MINKIYEKIKQFTIKNYKYLIFIGVLIIVFNIKLPYFVYSPGGNINLDERISIDGESNLDGTYNMAYVTVYNGLIPAILLSYIIPNWDIVPASEVTLEEQSLEDMLIVDKLNIESSLDNATILAYEKASKELNIKKVNLNVGYTLPEADTNILVGDIVKSIDGIEVKDFSDIDNIIKSKIAGDTLEIIVSRDDKDVTTNSTLQLIDDELKIGIVFITTYDIDETPDMQMELKSGESGPSGGLMLSLAIYDKLVSEDLTRGLKIVGTGTIDIDGTVGVIDGVKYKLLGSKDADIFFCPEDNYDEAIEVKEEYDLEMEIYKVKSFDEAIDILNSLD